MRDDEINRVSVGVQIFPRPLVFRFIRQFRAPPVDMFYPEQLFPYSVPQRFQADQRIIRTQNRQFPAGRAPHGEKRMAVEFKHISAQ